MPKVETVQNCSHLRGLRIVSFQTFDRCDLGQSGYRALGRIITLHGVEQSGLFCSI
jgi:hypothetical protein